PLASEPDTELGYKSNNERVEGFNVPGVVNPDEPIGIQNGNKTFAPTDLPPPPGFGVGAQGGTADAPGVGPGPGAAVGMVGGYGLQGMPLGGTFYGRSGATKEKALIDGGGTPETEAAVARGLKWIVRQQIQQGQRAGCF